MTDRAAFSTMAMVSVLLTAVVGLWGCDPDMVAYNRWAKSPALASPSPAWSPFPSPTATPPSGSAATPMPGLDPAVIGKWALDVPGVSWTDRTYDGNTVIDTTHSSVGATMGLIVIQVDGHYTWYYHDGSVRSSGVVVPYHPDPSLVETGLEGKTFYTVSDGSRAVYLVSSGDGAVAIYSGATLNFTADGRKTRS